MALFPGQGAHIDVDSEVAALRSQGLTDQQIVAELAGKGAKEQQVISSLSKLGADAAPGAGFPGPGGPQGMPTASSPPADPFAAVPQPSANPFPSHAVMPGTGGMGVSHSGSGDSAQDLYDRIEEITEEMIDEKWDDLIKEVRKIVEWKNTVETKIHKMESDLSTLKDDFKVLHQGVLGKVEEYDKRMQEVGTELKAVGKVFKDVVPVFTENVKELRHITKGMKEEK